jgi:hypothetical protein
LDAGRSGGGGGRRGGAVVCALTAAMCCCRLLSHPPGRGLLVETLRLCVGALGGDVDLSCAANAPPPQFRPPDPLQPSRERSCGLAHSPCAAREDRPYSTSGGASSASSRVCEEPPGGPRQGFVALSSGSLPTPGCWYSNNRAVASGVGAPIDNTPLEAATSWRRVVVPPRVAVAHTALATPQPGEQPGVVTTGGRCVRLRDRVAFQVGPVLSGADLTQPTRGDLPCSPPSEQQVHSKVSLRRAVDAV